MEQFRACERDSKTKAFSKEGLSLAAQETDEKDEIRTWIAKSIRGR
jgi:CCR4-NOT transcriptional regulation complex NOT5 subunit